MHHIAAVTRVMHRAAVVGLFTCMLVGCSSAPPRVQTQVITVTRDVYVQIPDKLTAHCDIAPPQPTFGGAVQVARQRGASLEGCNAKLDQIHAIQGAPVEH